MKHMAFGIQNKELIESLGSFLAAWVPLGNPGPWLLQKWRGSYKPFRCPGSQSLNAWGMTYQFKLPNPMAAKDVCWDAIRSDGVPFSGGHRVPTSLWTTTCTTTIQCLMNYTVFNEHPKRQDVYFSSKWTTIQICCHCSCLKKAFRWMNWSKN